MTPPTMMNAWNEIAQVRPTAAKAEQSDFARAAVASPRTQKSRNRMRTPEAPRRPISSAIAEKMKSLCTKGMVVESPLPMPTPESPPSASE